MKNIIGLFVALSRAIEIAKLGNHTVSVCFDDDYKEGFDDYESIKNFYSGWFDSFVENGDIKIELFKPQDYEQNRQCETIIDIQKRIDKALLHKKPEIKLCNASQQLLKTAIGRIGLSLSQVEKIKEVAQTIAQLDLSDKIMAWHIAEAIQYSYNFDDDKKLNAEKKSIVFGGMIEVRMCFIDNETINAAIEYLQKMKY